jgi:hypothetical protein
MDNIAKPPAVKLISDAIPIGIGLSSDSRLRSSQGDGRNGPERWEDTGGTGPLLAQN